MSAQVMSQVFEGTWEELQNHADELAGKHLRVEVVDTGEAPTSATLASTRTGIWKGMFPHLRDLDETDFRAAEWRGEELDDE
jgi:hypothetical protein